MNWLTVILMNAGHRNYFTSGQYKEEVPRLASSRVYYINILPSVKICKKQIHEPHNFFLSVAYDERIN